MADKSNDLLVGLDIGSSKVVCMIASPVSSSTFKIEGLGECKSEGIEQGGVVDINQAVDCVRAAVEEAEKMEQLAKELETMKDQYLRLAAEYDNYRKRTAKEKEQIYSDAKMATVKEFLGV